MKPGERWLATLWPPRSRPSACAAGTRARSRPASLGGFVPVSPLERVPATGADPNAPDTPDYHRVEFEHLELPQRVDAVIASTSLHHVADPAAVIDRLATTLGDDGTLVVVEWAWETFDEATADWCFQRLGQDDENWLHRLRDEWTSSGQEWQRFLSGWANKDGLHRGEALLQLLDERFDRRLLACAPYFFPDLADTTDADEQAAIAAGLIRATRIDWVGGRR